MTIETRSMPIEHQARKTVDAPQPRQTGKPFVSGQRKVHQGVANMQF